MGMIFHMILIIATACCSICVARNAEHEIRELVMTNYDKHGRPVINVQDNVTVGVEFVLEFIEKVDKEAGSVRLTNWLRLAWKDPQLTWNSSAYDGINMIPIFVDELWTPGLIFYDSRQPFEDSVHNIPAFVYSSGDIYWATVMNIEVSCNVDVSEETYVCEVVFGPWVYHGNQVHMTFLSGGTGLDMSRFKTNHEYELADHKTVLNVTYYSCCPDPYETIIYTFTLKKQFDSVALYLAPTIVLGLFLPVMFIIPPEFTEKIVFGVGLLIANILSQMLAIELIPSGHPKLDLLEDCHFVNIILNALALAIAAIVLKIWANGLRGLTMPGFMKNYILHCCGCLFCVKHKDFVNNYTPTQDMAMKDSRASSEMNMSALLSSSQEEMAYWKQLAVVMDRIAFFVFLIIAIVVTVMLLI